jgi:hypothetical protein
MTYACPARELAADIYLLKLQHLQNKVLRTIGNFQRCTLVRDFHMNFNLPVFTIMQQNLAGNKRSHTTS